MVYEFLAREERLSRDEQLRAGWAGWRWMSLDSFEIS